MLRLAILMPRREDPIMDVDGRSGKGAGCWWPDRTLLDPDSRTALGWGRCASTTGSWASLAWVRILGLDCEAS